MSDNLKRTIAELFGQEPPAIFDSRHGQVPIPSPDVAIGIELEIENWGERDQRHPGFVFTTDGSLRNNGIEAITKPVRMMHAPNLLSGFFKRFEVTEDNYSERCSTHVHVNAQDMTLEQVATLVLLYQTLERVLFAFVGHDRDKNIFCVPWSQSNLTYNIVNQIAYDPNYVFGKWAKYTALNLVPLRARNQGTVEFRHLHGTCDMNVIHNWLTLIGRMREYAVNTPMSQLKGLLENMNTVSNYAYFMEMVFQSDLGIVTNIPNYEEMLSAGVTDTKFMMFQEIPQKKAAPKYFIPEPATGGWNTTGEVAADLNDHVQAVQREMQRIREQQALAQAEIARQAQAAQQNDLQAAVRTLRQARNATVAEGRARRQAQIVPPAPVDPMTIDFDTLFFPTDDQV